MGATSANGSSRRLCRGSSNSLQSRNQADLTFSCSPSPTFQTGQRQLMESLDVRLRGMNLSSDLLSGGPIEIHSQLSRSPSSAFLPFLGGFPY